MVLLARRWFSINQNITESVIRIRREMKTFIVLSFSLCLVEGSEGLPCFMRCFLPHLILYGLSAVLCNLDMFQRWKRFPSFGRRSDLKSIQHNFVISNVLNDHKTGLSLDGNL